MLITHRTLTYLKGYSKGLAQARKYGDPLAYIAGGIVTGIYLLLWFKVF